jgi:outer membrane protein TolC
MKLAILLAVAALTAAPAFAAEKSRKSSTPARRAFTLGSAVSLALKQNPDILKAIHEIERTRGQIIEVRAQALPQLVNTGTYNQQDPRLLEVQGGTLDSTGGGTRFVQDKSWQIAFEVRQLVYSGGQVKAAVKVARLAEDTSYHILRETVNQVIATVRTQFFTVLLNRELITVAEESIQLLSDQLQDQQNRFSAGTVPRFNVLQAEVALANARPDLIRAKNNYLIARLQLARILGLDAKSPIDVTGSLQANPRDLSLSSALATARKRRALLKAQDNTVQSEHQNITIAAAGYKPRLSVDAGYELKNSRLSDSLSDEANGWYVGVTGTWNIFDGLATKGRVDQANARLASAKVSYADSVRQGGRAGRRGAPPRQGTPRSRSRHAARCVERRSRAHPGSHHAEAGARQLPHCDRRVRPRHRCRNHLRYRIRRPAGQSFQDIPAPRKG